MNSQSELSLVELTSPRKEEPLLSESSPTTADERGSEHVRWLVSSLPSRYPQRTMAAGLGRPPSYSDSFLLGSPAQTSFFLKDFSNSALAVCQETKETSTQTDSEPVTALASWPRLGERKMTCNFASFFKRTGSFLFHIWLISIFETVFFFGFISKSEDQGILKTVDNYIFAATTACSNISSNATAFLNDVLPLFVNSSNIATDATNALQQRNATNEKLLIQAWMYVGSLFILLVGAGAVAKWKRLLTRRSLLKILLENFGLVALLGIYEFIFFRTIIYNYDALSAAEISEDAVQTLRAGCGLFV
jgi:hypothetical protein